MKPLMQGLDDARVFLQKQEMDDLHKQHSGNVSTLIKAQEAQLKDYAGMRGATPVAREKRMDNHNKLHGAMLEKARTGEAIEPPSRAAVSRSAPPVSSLASLTLPRSPAAPDNALGALGTDISTTMSADSNSDAEPSISRSSTTTFASLHDDVDDAVSEDDIQLDDFDIPQALSILATPPENLPNHPSRLTWKLDGDEKYAVIILDHEKPSAIETRGLMIEQLTAMGIDVGNKIQMTACSVINKDEKDENHFLNGSIISIDKDLIEKNRGKIMLRVGEIQLNVDKTLSPRGP
jgi:hypothetical protein